MLSRHMLRSSSLRQTSVSASTAAARVARLSTTRVDRVRSSAHALYATGGVSQQPGSKTFKELGQNAIEETKGIAQTVINTVSAKESGKLDNVDAAKDKLRDAKDDSMGTLKSDLVRMAVSSSTVQAADPRRTRRHLARVFRTP